MYTTKNDHVTSKKVDCGDNNFCYEHCYVHPACPPCSPLSRRPCSPLSRRPCSPFSRRPCSPLLSVTVHVAGQTASRDVGYVEALPLFTTLPSPLFTTLPSPLFTLLPSPLFTPPVCDSARGRADSQPGRRLRGGPAPVHPSPVAPVHPSPVAPVHPSPVAPVHPSCL